MQDKCTINEFCVFQQFNNCGSQAQCGICRKGNTFRMTLFSFPGITHILSFICVLLSLQLLPFILLLTTFPINFLHLSHLSPQSRLNVVYIILHFMLAR